VPKSGAGSEKLFALCVSPHSAPRAQGGINILSMGGLKAG
jgi:hypothetical protein